MIERKIVDKIEEYNKVIIVRHKRPDGDCIGSSLGLRAILRNSYPEKEIKSYGLDSVEYLNFLGSEDNDEQKNDPEYYKDALVIVVDTANMDRISNEYYNNAKEIIKIDHHILDNSYGDIEWVEEENIAVCSMITKLWLANKDRLIINKEAAICLFTGLVTDSGRFRYSGISLDSMTCAGELINVGIDIEWIYSNLYLKDYSNIVLSGELCRRVKITENGVAYIYISKRLRNKLGLSLEEANNMISVMDSIKGSLIWIGFIENEDKTIRVRLRSRFTTVNQIAVKHNGGGHDRASGATAYSKNEMKLIIKEADDHLREYKANNKGWL